jgi:hypothetical protein
MTLWYLCYPQLGNITLTPNPHRSRKTTLQSKSKTLLMTPPSEAHRAPWRVASPWLRGPRQTPQATSTAQQACRQHGGRAERSPDESYPARPAGEARVRRCHLANATSGGPRIYQTGAPEAGEEQAEHSRPRQEGRPALTVEAPGARRSDTHFGAATAGAGAPSRPGFCSSGGGRAVAGGRGSSSARRQLGSQLADFGFRVIASAGRGRYGSPGGFGSGIREGDGWLGLGRRGCRIRVRGAGAVWMVSGGGSAARWTRDW